MILNKNFYFQKKENELSEKIKLLEKQINVCKLLVTIL